LASAYSCAAIAICRRLLRQAIPLAVSRARLIAGNLHSVGNPAVNAEGNIYSTDSGPRGQKTAVSVYRITPGGDMQPFVSGITNATGLALDANGYLYVSSRMDGTVHRVSPQGASSVYAEGMGIATGIAFDNYRYKQPAFYTPEAMNALLAGYKAAGWKHLVNANQTAANTAQPEHPVTDLWLHFSGADIDAVTVLTRGVKTMNVVRVTGDLRPLDLLHLGGHFGIPKVDPNAVMVPDKQ